MGASNYLRSNPALIAEEQARCFELKVQGKSIREIAAITGLTKSTVDNRIKAECDERVTPAREEYRKYELSLLDKSVATVQGVIDRATDDELLLKAIDRMTRLMDRRAKLLGLDTPVQTEITVREGRSEVDQELLELLAGQDQSNDTTARMLEHPVQNPVA